jgi:DNA-directed RNA polymerase specialized sigma24 family protein
MEQLQRIDPELVEMVDLTFFAGMTAAEAAAVLGVSSRTVERGLRTARAFLRGVLGEGSGARDPRT